MGGWSDYASAPPLGTAVAPLAALAEGATALTVESEKGRFPLIVVRRGAAVHAFVNACPHQFLPLDYRGAALLSADGARLMCSSHGAAFDAATGEGIDGPGLGLALDTVPLRVADETVLIGT